MSADRPKEPTRHPTSGRILRQGLRYSPPRPDDQYAMQQTRPKEPTRNPDDMEPGYIRSQLPKVVATIKLDVYDILFISLILAAGATSHVLFMPS